MAAGATSAAEAATPAARLDALFAELAELTGQRNAIDGRIVDIVAEIDRAGLCGITGARSVPALVAWKTGLAPRNAETVVTVARRSRDFPRCADALREGRLSLDQVGVVAERAADSSDAHYAELAASATVSQLRTAIKLEPQPAPDPERRRPRSITKSEDAEGTTWRIRLTRLESAAFEAALRSHQDAVVAEWTNDRETSPTGVSTPPFPDAVDGFMRLVEAGWDADAARRPHGHRTTVVVHVDIDPPDGPYLGELHLGSVLTADERRYVTCDATWEMWLERRGQLVGSGRTTRQINRRLRRALEFRDRCCAVPGCGATRGLHAHHIQHWEDGGTTELDNLVLLCPYHHRLHHAGGITITGPAGHLRVVDASGRQMNPRSLARPPTSPAPAVRPYRGPTGEHAQWWWYDPYCPEPPDAESPQAQTA